MPKNMPPREPTAMSLLKHQLSFEHKSKAAASSVSTWMGAHAIAGISTDF